MDEYNYNQIDPWDDGVYGTGKTKPPKSRGGIIALLLVVVIFLSGIASALGILNIKLFRQLNDRQESSVPMSFSICQETEAVLAAEGSISENIKSPKETAPSSDVSIDLNQSPESMDNIPQEGGMSWQDIYVKNIPSVVSISCSGYGISSTGTGVIVSDRGYIVTNCHVVESADEITVTLTDERSFSARLVGEDALSDLAVLYIDAADLIPAEFGNSASLRVGDAVAAIGDPLGTELRGSMTDGIVSAINRDVTVGNRTMTLIQTNAALNSGNSGGPLINCYGQVIGINTVKISAFADESGVEGLGFAIPSTTVKDIVDQLIKQGYVSGRPSLGIVGEGISTFDQHYYRLPAGLYITEVDPWSDAGMVGIQAGDILISIDNMRITTMEALEAVIYNHEVGDTVTVIIYRSGRQYTATLTLSEAKG